MSDGGEIGLIEAREARAGVRVGSVRRGRVRHSRTLAGAVESGSAGVAPVGGVRRAVGVQSVREGMANGVVCLTHAVAADVETRDVCDRAHLRFNQTDVDVTMGTKLFSAAKLNGEASPRRYPACAMTSRGVAHDSAPDELHERQRRLRLLLGEVAGVTGRKPPESETYARADLRLEIRLRDLVDRNGRAFKLPRDAAAIWLERVGR